MGLTPNVVPNTPITSAWGNEIRDRTVQVFLNAAERSTQWTTPPTGAVSYLVDSQRVYRYNGTTWVAISPAGMLGITGMPVPGAWIGGSMTNTGLTVNVTAEAGRLLKINVVARVGADTASESIDLAIREGNTSLNTFRRLLASNLISETVTGHTFVNGTPGGPHTYYVGLQRVSGAGNCRIDAGDTFPAYLSVEDVGTAV